VVACNEALKAADVKLISIRPFGATGRLVLSGTESEIDSAAQAALAILDKLNAELEAGPGTAKAHDENKYSR
jgi:ethanolamine utilization microcompartment shell protein EutS